MKISVCIATFNGERFIKEQIASILPQLSSDDEIIISDDSSSDKTIEILKSFKDPRIIIFSKQKYFSPIFNFENAIKNSSGDIIFLSDQDDIWFSDKLQIVLKYLKDYDVVLTDCCVVDSNLNIIHESFFECNKSKRGILTNIYKNSYLGCCLAFKRNATNLALPFPKDIPMHDVWLGFVFELFFRVKFLDRSLIFYRRHGNNASLSSERSTFTFFKRAKFRLNVLKYLPLLLLRKFRRNFNKL